MPAPSLHHGLSSRLRHGLPFVQLLLILGVCASAAILGGRIGQVQRATDIAQRIAHQLMDPAGHAGPFAPAWARLDTCVTASLAEHPQAMYQPADVLDIVGPCQVQAQAPGVEVATVEFRMINLLGPTRSPSARPTLAPVMGTASGWAPFATTVLTWVLPLVLLGLVGIVARARRTMGPTERWWHPYRDQPLASGDASSGEPGAGRPLV